MTGTGHVQYSGEDGWQDTAAVFQRISVRHQRDASDVIGRDVIAGQQRTGRHSSHGSQIAYASKLDQRGGRIIARGLDRRLVLPISTC